MKKLFSALLVVLMLFCMLPGTVLADEIVNTPEEKALIKTYWPDYADRIVKIDDWFYMVGTTETGEVFPHFICGYDGTETDITLPTEVNGRSIDAVSYFYLISDTVKSITIPKEIRSLAYNSGREVNYNAGGYFTCNKEGSLEKFIVEDGHPYLTAIDGVLFRNNNQDLLQYPLAKPDTEYTVSKNVKYIRSRAFWGARNLKTLTITENVEEFGTYMYPETLETLYFKNIIFPGVWGIFGDPHGETNVALGPNLTVYLPEGYELHQYYLDYCKDYCKEIKTLPKPKAPSKPKIKSVKYSDTKNAMVITLKKQSSTGFKIYRYDEKTDKYVFLSNFSGSVYYDKTAKAGYPYKYKVTAYNEVDFAVSESEAAFKAFTEKAPPEGETIVKPPKEQENEQITESSLDNTEPPNNQAVNNDTLADDEKEDTVKNNKKENNNLWIIITVIVAVCAIGAAVGILFYNKRKKIK